MSGVFSIPPTVPFLDVLADDLLREYAGNPMALSRAHVLLPNRRACLGLRDAFLRIGKGRPLMLPRITPLGDVDEDGLWLEGRGADVPPAAAAMHRQLVLARLLLARDVGQPVDQAVRLAKDLGGFFDTIQREGVSPEALADIVPDAYAAHWQDTLRFLDVVTTVWPGLMAADGAVSLAERRNRLLLAQAAAWTDSPPPYPVIAAGSTGSIPATAVLLSTIAALPHGRVILPGFDPASADQAAAADPTHPQYGMLRLLSKMGVSAESVEDWPVAEDRWVAVHESRYPLFREAMRPSAVVNWSGVSPDRNGLAGIRLVESGTPHEEASMIAMLLREAMEVPGKTAAVITPDRSIARRVAAELARWGIQANDSAGVPVSDTLPATFLRLTAAAVAQRLAPVSLLAALKHPLASGGIEQAAFRRRVRRMERKMLRGPRPATGCDGLIAAVEEVTPADTALALFVDDIVALVRPFVDVMEGGPCSLGTLLRVHIQFAEALAGTDLETGPDRIWRDDAGEALARLVTDIADAADGLGEIDPTSYPALLDALLDEQVVRPRYVTHPRISIWGTLEARLQRPDLVIVAGLNEGTWPGDPTPDPWLSRAMRAALGLPAPERQVGQAAHDFLQAVCATEVVMTRATRVDGTPTIRSRWLQRLITYLGEDVKIDGRADLVAWQKAIDASPTPPQAIAPPLPCPPVTARPRRLSVTEVEKLMRDPYSVYANRILLLRALEPLDMAPTAADYGSVIHRAVEEFVRIRHTVAPGDALTRLLGIGRDIFGRTLDHPAVWGFWWPRFERAAAWFVEADTQRLGALAESHVEVAGELSFQSAAGPFTLSAKADRLDVGTDGLVTIVDYKSGQPPSWSTVLSGVSPQLPLEAAILNGGGFAGVAATSVAGLEYWRLKGGDPAGEISVLKRDADAVAQAALDGVTALVAEFDDPDTPYPAQPMAARAPDYSDYSHLARVREWSGA